MAENTKIEWCEHTHNEWIGCTEVSPACQACYAAHLMDTRLGRVKWGRPGEGAGTRSLTSEANRRKPYAWDRKAKLAGVRPFVFCSSLADVFDNQVPWEWRADLFKTIVDTPHLVWLLLTKRPQNIARMWAKVRNERGVILPWPGNAAIGATCEDQERLDINAPHLLSAAKELKPAFTFLSCEPLLGPLAMMNYLANRNRFPDHIDRKGAGHWRGPYIDWVITGGETDQGKHLARPSNPRWYADIRDQCTRTATPFLHKQNGEWTSYDQIGANGWEFTREVDGERYGMVIIGGRRPMFSRADFPTRYPFPKDPDPGPCMIKVGKKLSGRLLDGREWNERPRVAA